MSVATSAPSTWTVGEHYGYPGNPFGFRSKKAAHNMLVRCYLTRPHYKYFYLLHLSLSSHIVDYTEWFPNELLRQRRMENALGQLEKSEAT